MKTKEELKSEINIKIKEYYDLFFKDKKSSSIPVSGKKFDEKEFIAIVEAALDGWWTEGKVTFAFERRVKDYLGINHVIVVNSGSSANLLALKALTSAKLGERKLNPGDEVITVAAGFPTTINPIVQCDCIPVFCDVDLETYNINVEQLKQAISSKTKAIFLAHTLGNPFNLREIKKICQENNLWLIEDCCDALGSKYNNQLVGTFGDLATFSFYPAHHITMGEGGALTTNNNLLAKIIISMRDWGRDCYCKTGQDNSCGKRYSQQLGDLPYGYDHKYIYSELGYNLKNTDLNVAIGLAQMDKLDEFIKKRKENFKSLSKGLSEFKDYFYLPRAEENSDPSWFGFLITLKESCKFKREDLLKYLNENKIGTRLLFSGNIIRQPSFIDNNVKYRVVDELKNTDYIVNNTFWVGVCPAIIKEDINHIVDKIKIFLEEFNNGS
ncbi:MAG: lipopolysaccharide biosynthesis protein RfbH [Nanoarchaeota archaeon]